MSPKSLRIQMSPKILEFKLVQMSPNESKNLGVQMSPMIRESKLVQMTPNESEWVQMSPNESNTDWGGTVEGQGGG